MTIGTDWLSENRKRRAERFLEQNKARMNQIPTVEEIVALKKAADKLLPVQKLPVIKETAIQRAILDYLRHAHIYHWRQNTAGRVVGFGTASQRYIPTAGALRGVADILGFHKGGFFALEVKRPGNHATPEQMEFLQAVVEKGGGRSALVTSVDEVRAFFEKWN